VIGAAVVVLCAVWVSVYVASALVGAALIFYAVLLYRRFRFGGFRRIIVSGALTVGAARDHDSYRGVPTDWLSDWISSHPIGAPCGANPIDDLVRTLKRLRTGAMAIDAPETMWVQKKEAVKVSLGKADMATVVAALGKVRHKPIVKEIKVDTLMRVELSGDAFEIEWPEHVDKALREDEPAVWEFRVTPLRRGLQTLTIRGVVRVRIPKGDEQEFYELPVVEHKIDVRVKRASSSRSRSAP
jgi:hypothetical protein